MSNAATSPDTSHRDDSDDALFKALAHRTRRHLLDALKAGPRTTGALCDSLPGLDRCTVMQHLKVLEEAGLIAVERRGRERWNHLDALPIHAIHERWIGPYAAYAASMLSRLKRTTEQPAAAALLSATAREDDSTVKKDQGRPGA